VSKIALKPCPFCGKQPTVWFDGGDPGEGYNIDCCCISVYSVGKNDAIRKWNTRHEPKEAGHKEV